MQTDALPAQRTAVFRLHADIVAKLNFAAHQSAFSVLRRLQAENLHTEQRFEDLVLTLESNPAFIKKKIWPVDRVGPQGLISIADRDLEVDGSILLNLTDSLRGTATFRLKKDGNILAELLKPVELLAYNEWGGAGYMPELLAAFSMPNDPAVDKILRDAGQILRRAGRRDQIEGYQSRSRERVWEIVSAIYSAIANLGLTYAAPPASFERDGQKIRLPSQIIDGRVATCLDTAMLFTSAFEQAGLNPIVALPKDHALAGVWLQPEDLASITIDEAETLRKRIDLRELVLIETTCVTSHPAPSFSKALAAANDSIRPNADDTFTAAVDIRRARAHRITPLGLKSDTTSTHIDGDTGALQLPLEPAPSLPGFDNPESDSDKPDTPQSRLERWQRKLLDLTLRNPLLNHRATKASLQIICPKPGRLEDKLAEGSRIQISSIPQPTSEGQDEEIHRKRAGELITVEFARDELEQRRVLVDLPPEQLSQRAVEIYRKAQTALQEGGANTLYLAIGFLLWKRDLKDSRKFRAPLILLPVTLERKSVRSGIKMLAHDDEPRFNTTLLEMLRRDFQIAISGLDEELPKDESGIDVAAIWNSVRYAVKDAPGFEVVEEVVLGHFSFAKYLMWKDLVDRAEALRSNDVVRHLIDTPRDPFSQNIDFADPRQLDSDYKPSDLLTTLPADSSQMAAIATADRGMNFVIIGPPGTGKSQTISNLIGHLLGKGKTVLFVSEKTAALEVVYRRLAQIGLDRFCLELHSNKARKADVLKQLEAAWKTAGLNSETDWKQKADDLLVMRDRLNHLVNRLHEKRRNGLTAHYAMGVKVRDEQIASRVTLFWPTSDHHDEVALVAMREVVEKLSIQAKAIRDISKSPFNLVDTTEWTPQWEDQIIRRAGALSAAAGNLERVGNALCKAIGIVLPGYSLAQLDALGELASLLIDSYKRQTAYALNPDGADIIEALGEAVEKLKNYVKAQGSLSCKYEPFAWRTLNGADLEQRLVEAESKWWLRRSFAKRRITKHMRENGAQGNPDPLSDALALATMRQQGEAIDRLDHQLSNLNDWRGYETEPAVLESLRLLGERAQTAIGKLAKDPQALMEIRGKVRSLLHDGNDLLAAEGSVGRLATAFLDGLERLQQASGEFEDIAGASVRNAFSTEDHTLPQIRETADTIQARHNELRDWCAWRRRRGEAIDAGLLPLVEAVEQGRVPPDEIEETFETAYCTWWSTAIMGEDEVLRTFSAPEHEATIEKFRQIDDDFQKLTAAYIAAKLLGKLPDQDNVTRNSQWGVLRRELQKKRRHKPVRKLLEEAPEVLTSLAPCFMMSPLSVAQYLPTEQALFDVVIFDEASQITVWDAVGSIARGRQAIVAGDPRQMPPTNFFSRTEDDPDGDIDTDGDLESILDEMRGAGIPERTLNLHYRSRHESLIAFSNDRYYGNELITFPGPEVADRAVRIERPGGFYARGSARHNQEEARAIVDEIVRRLMHQDSAVRERSIGVVTFNSEQQTLIEDLLDNARSKHPEIEYAFSREHITEPVFVKNLETVQGDERDVILFSVTYGPDRSGHVTMNFGPLNRAGGERRLNVAVTRARSEMVVFSTLHPDQIDLSRTQARAVADLKLFLEFAEKGLSVLGNVVQGYADDFESPFEVAVARELRMKGWQIHPQVGVSAYRIDLGIVRPDAPGRYLAGIECDGAMYHSSAFARERDKIRQAVLENLGWTIVRIWSTDWWTNKEGALKKVDDVLRHHLEETQREEAGRERVKGPEQDNGKELDDGISVPDFAPSSTKSNDEVRHLKFVNLLHLHDDSGDTKPNDETPCWSENDCADEISAQSVQEEIHERIASGADQDECSEPMDVAPAQGRFVPYPRFQGPTGPDPRSASSAQVAEGLCRIIRIEGPVLAKRAYDIYLRGCGVNRMGGEIKRLMNKALQHAIRRNLVVKEDEWGVGGLVRSIARSPDTPPVIARKRGPRNFDEIPPSELQLVARQLLLDRMNDFEFGSEAHLKAVLDVFELRRLTTPVRVKLRDILKRRYPYVDEVLERS